MIRIIFTVAALLALVVPLQQSPVTAAQLRNNDRVDEIARSIDQKAQQAWSVMQGRADQIRNSRNESGMQLYLAVSNFVDSASVLSQFAPDASVASMRSGARILISQAEEVRRLMRRSSSQLADDWTEVELEVARLSDAFGLRYAAARSLPRYDPYDPYGRSDTAYGSFRWRGQVDGSDYIVLRGSSVTIRHLKANPISGASYDLAAPLPRRAEVLQLRRIQGRGRVELTQQPSAYNNYTAMVLIEDDDGGPDFYEFELTWGR